MKRASERGIVSRDGVELGYVREGAGQPILVIGTATYYPRAFSAELRQGYELIFVDSRHFVPSYRPREHEMDGVTFETLADDVEAIRLHLGIDEWIVLGHSIHAQIAMAYARKYSARTSRLVLVAGVPFSLAELSSVAESFWNEHASEERKRQHVVNRTAIEEALSTTSPSRQFAVNYLGDAAKFWVDPTYDAAWLWENVETSPIFERLVEGLPSRSEARSMLQGLQMPTLVVLGKLDYAIPHVAWEQVVDGLENLDYVLLAEDSHNPQTEFPERFDRALIDWLEA
jgi:proline iminopeptidase